MIPVYNVERYLEECLNSVINQTFQNIEIVIVNDGSTDNSLDIIRRIQNNDNRIVVIDKPNEGVIATKKKGVEAASGKYIFQLDGDDFLSINALEHLLKKATETNADIVIGDYTLLYRNVVLPVFLKRFFPLSDNLTYIKTQFNNPFYLCNKLIRKEVLEKIDFPADLLMCEEIPILSQMVPHLKIIAKIDANTIFYRQRNSGLTKLKNRKAYTANYTANLFAKEFFESQSFYVEIKKELAAYFINTVYCNIHCGLNLHSQKRELKLFFKAYWNDKEIRSYLLKKMQRSRQIFFVIARINIPLSLCIMQLIKPILNQKNRFREKNYELFD